VPATPSRPPDDPEPSAEVAAPDPVPAGPHRVLVVDDSPVNRRFAETLVERRGLAVASAENGSAALDLLAAEPFDLVLLDGMMPGLDGPAVAREIRRREASAGLDRIPIVALTASLLPEDRDRMLEAGMDDHLAKPYSPDDLGRILGRRLGNGVGRRTRPIPARTAPTAAAPAAGDGPPVLDVEAFARLADLGDAMFVERIVRLLLADAAERVAQVDDAIEAHDAVRLRRTLLALEGICGNLGAVALDRRTRAIHDELRRREDRGEDPFGPGLGPSGLEPLLDATRIQLQEQAATTARR
jgi:two-component system, NarL family, sensor histidine kinase BarA